MKKILLFLPAILITIPLFAQQSIMHQQRIGERKIDVAALRAEMKKTYAQPNAAHKTTGPGGSRWYSYPGAMDTATAYAQPFGGTLGVATTVHTIWNDTNGTENYPTGLAHNKFVSQANIFDPKARLFNHDPSAAYVGEIEITSADAYTCDSVDIYGVYEYNVTKTTFCDTLRLLFTKGNGGPFSTSNIGVSGGTMGTGGHYPSVTFGGMLYDKGTNKATGYVTADLHYQDIILCNSGATPAWGDTNAAGTWVRRIAVNGAAGISCAAGDVLGCSFTFISGDPETRGAGKLASPTPGDTLVTTSVPGANEYNIWRPLITYYSDAGGTSPQWAPYLETATPGPADHNIGLWAILPFFKHGWEDTLYVPMWAWGDDPGGTASTLQFPFINWGVTCPACNLLPLLPVKASTLNDEIVLISVSPNPANNHASIAFSLAQAADVSVSLTNVIGQVVATQEIANTSNGRATFNTTSLPPGVYVYTISANGEKATGRIVVAH